MSASADPTDPTIGDTDVTNGTSSHPGRADEAERLQTLLLEAEQRAASVPQLQLRVAQLERALAASRQEAHEARVESMRIDQRLTESEQVLVDVMSSPSWQVTKPLRRAKNLLR